MKNHLNEIQMKKLSKTLEIILNDFEVFKKHKPLSVEESKKSGLINSFSFSQTNRRMFPEYYKVLQEYNYENAGFT